ncbi:MAG: hypothetical protein QUS09_05155, partial [Methanotrichaceae archaeon]|nr:hypothetical protein [Methanotrichaceae archaeon]
MKILPEIIKEIGLYLLLFIAVSTVAVSEDTQGKFTETIAIFGNDSVETGNNYESTNGETPEISVTIVETPSSEDVDDTNTGEITDSEDSNADDNQDTGVM